MFLVQKKYRTCSGGEVISLSLSDVGSGSILYMRVVVGSVFVRLGMGTSIFVVVDPCTGRTDSVDVLVATLGDSDVAALATAPL